MGSGCTVSNNTLNSSFQRITDTSVRYTGAAIPSLGICSGDSLDEIEAVILQKILDFSLGHGITIEEIDLTTCDCFVQKVGCCGKETCQTLVCILEAYLECMCELYADVADLKVKVSAMYDGPYAVKCLTGITATSKLPAIITAITADLCTTIANLATLTTQVNNLTTGLPTTIGNQVLSMLQSCNSSMVKSGTGASATVTFKGFPPIGTITMMAASGLANFDSSGLGKTGTDACGWALADGRNGTQNMIGLVPVGTTDMSGTPPISGATLPAGTTGGQYEITLTGAMCAVPPHSHNVTDPGHSHNMRVGTDSASGSKFNFFMKADGNNWELYGEGHPLQGAPSGTFGYIKKNTTGITIGAAVPTGGGSGGTIPHENKMPYRALYFIQRIA